MSRPSQDHDCQDHSDHSDHSCQDYVWQDLDSQNYIRQEHACQDRFC